VTQAVRLESLTYGRLAPVRRRQRWMLVLRSAVLGFLVGSVGGVLLGLSSWLWGWPASAWSALVPAAAGAALGTAFGFVWVRNWTSAAAAVDAHYRLKDRALTALAFVTRPSTTPMHELQVRDAVQHLTTVKAPEVVPFRLPRTLPYAAGAFALAILLCLRPYFQPVADAGVPEPLEAVLIEAQRIEEDLKEFEELAKQEQNKDLERLVEEMKQMVEEMKQPGVEVKDALAKISEMQASITQMQAQLNIGLVDGQMQALGEALASVTATEGAGKALAEAKYEKAEQELEKLEEPQLDRKDAKELEEKLKKVAKSAADVGLGQLSETAAEMAEGAKGGSGKFKKSTKELTKQVRNQRKRRRINDFLIGELARLEEGKGNFGRNGGQKIKMPYKSVDGSSNWGLEVSGNVQGSKTNLLSQRKTETITGNAGDGPSDIETEHSAEGREQAGRLTRERHAKYQRMSEAVLDSEPIPLGHRQTIRKYFQLIRPQEADATAAEPKGGAK
jgi:hypothetical protein